VGQKRKEAEQEEQTRWLGRWLSCRQNIISISSCVGLGAFRESDVLKTVSFSLRGLPARLQAVRPLQLLFETLAVQTCNFGIQMAKFFRIGPGFEGYRMNLLSTTLL
jgi:hypothetical protein